MFVSPSNSNVEILTRSVMVLGSEAFGRCLAHEGGALMNGTNVLPYERDLRELCLPFSAF